jgi:hypothetical protein
VIDFEFTRHDRGTAVWVRLKAHLEDRLAAARQRNDVTQSEIDTAMLRGEIKCLKRLIALDDDRPYLTDTSDRPR